MADPVVITGMGILSSLGRDAPSTWQGVKEGRCGASTVSFLAGSDWPVRIGHEIKNFQSPDDAHLPRPTQFAIQAATEALDQANLPDKIHQLGSKTGCYMGAGIGAISPQEILQQLQDYKLEAEFSGLVAHLEKRGHNLLTRHHPHSLTQCLANKFSVAGPKKTFTTACSASAQAIGHAYRAIQRGEIDLAIVGGADSIVGEILMLGFCLLGVMSQHNDSPQQAGKPFDRKRDGFVIGEGAAILILESKSHAKARAARPFATICGYGESENAFRITDLPEDGAGAIAAMRSALQDSRLTGCDIGAINTHGTGTEPNDRIEAQAIAQVIGNEATVTANKANFGHLIAAAGAIECATSVMMIKDCLVPPIANFEQSDCTPLNYRKTTAPLDSSAHVLSNSFGFGGTNASLVIGPCDEADR